MDSPNAESWRTSRRLFAVLRAIVRRDELGENSAITDYASRLEGRIGALGRAHEMTLRAPKEGIDLEELIHGELLTHAVPAARYRVVGPDTRIHVDALLPLALLFHELAMNAVMHGALLTPQGEIDVQWQHLVRDEVKMLQLVWQEGGMPMRFTAPTAKGFGLELLERMLPYELDACARIDWKEPGVRVELEIPARTGSATWSPDAGRTP